MRCRASAFTDVNATTDLVHQHIAAAGRDVVVVVVRDQVVEITDAAVDNATTTTTTTTAVLATTDNATAANDTLFRRPHRPAHRQPTDRTTNGTATDHRNRQPPCEYITPPSLSIVTR